MNTDEIMERAREAMSPALNHTGVALLTTSTPQGTPHATWMATIGIDERNQLLTLTSPDSRKVANIRSNPRVEWMFTSKDMRSLVYFSGSAVVVKDVVKIKQYWNDMPEKDRAYFLDYFSSPPGFSIIRTSILRAELVCPRQFRSFPLDVKDLRSLVTIPES